MARHPNESGLSIDRLKSVLSYEPRTGIFTYLVQRGALVAGSMAGSPNQQGHIQIRIDRKAYSANRLAVFFVKGRWPEGEVDHKNLNRGDNRWDNLRSATSSQNTANRRRFSNNTSGYKGVHFNKKSRKYEAYLTLNYRRTHLGWFDSAEEAHTAYKTEAIRVFGSFARFE